ncbi:MAG: hypothetical protein KIT31_09195 [Deltaproteobacteria bacterium]|nr:hypothetical protein [Deltaproteobacteria bacterium]
MAPLPDGKYLIEDEVGVVTRGRIGDLDGDGVAERWASARGFCNVNGNCVHALANGKTCRPLGAVFGWELKVIGTGTWPEIEVIAQKLGMELFVRHRFDGRAYVENRQRLCLSDAAGGCSQCGPWEQLHDQPMSLDGDPFGPLRYAERCDPPE